ncbi:MAG: DUF2530 domain-containing protein [Actinomycetes bacterium]
MRILLRPSERRPDPEPLRTDDRKAVLVGIAVWVVVGAVLLVRRHDVVAAGNGWWLWCCAWGIGLGLAGLVYVHRRGVRSRR